MITTKIADNIECKYDRIGVIQFVDDTLQFDTSGGEYGPVSIPIQTLIDKLFEHKTLIQNNEDNKIS